MTSTQESRTGVIETGAVEDPVFPVSFAQQRLWFLHRLNPDNPVYNIAVSVHLEGLLVPEALREALAAMVERHEPLRTVYTVTDNEVVQIIRPGSQVEMPIEDLSALHGDQRAAADQIIQAQARIPFDLEHDLMLRAHLIRLAEREHILLICIHHIAADGWSMTIFFRELASLYGAFVLGKPSPLPSLPIQYADFAVWQRQCIQGERMERQLAYWRGQLAGAPPLLDLPGDRQRPSALSHRGAILPVRFDTSLAGEITKLSQEEKCTPFMILLAAFQIFLMRYAGQPDVVVGSPIANRTRAELEDILGCFVNTLALRGNLSGDPSFRELLQSVRRTTLDAYEHQDLPFEKLVDDLHPVRDRSYSPLFQTMFVLQNMPSLPGGFANLQAIIREVNTGTAKFDLSLSLVKTAHGFEGSFEYATDLFDAATVKRFAANFETLLTGIVTDPQQRISRLPILSEGERRQLLQGWTRPQLDFPIRGGFHKSIEAHAAAKPGEIAVVCGKDRVSYRELNARANKLARHLQSCGVGPETLVAVLMERSVAMITGLLAILKAGAAYVPLDPNYPPERLAVILSDCGAPVLITHQALLSKLPSTTARVLCSETLNLEEKSGDNLEVAVSPDNLAYVIFTSGSTGRPKGVAIEHRGVITLIEAMRGLFSEDELKGVLFSTSICFDVSVFELFVTLALGGKVIVSQNALDLPHLPAAREVVSVSTVPSAINELLRINAIPASVRVINLAGEPLPQELVDRLYELPGVQRVNDFYGPTEDTVYSTFAPRKPGGRANIGRPILNTQAYILDEHGQPVPTGVAGELHLAGDGLARGYWQLPELTREKFIRNSFSQNPRDRLYKTGDRARYRPDGTIEYLGRLDHQVKIRGFRIEPGEIESVLRKHPAVAECVVVPREDAIGKRLIAFVVASDPTPGMADLRGPLLKELPEYMVPAAFVFLPALPLTANGKIDRKALPWPEASSSSQRRISARDSLEQQLVRIWETLFDGTSVGVTDNFFELGGHSLLAVRLFVQVEKMTGRTLPLATLFEAPTIAQLATILRREGWEPPWLSLVPIKPNGSRLPFYCVHGVGGNILEYLDLAKYLDVDQPFYGIQAAGLTGKHPWHTTVEEMAAHYVKEIQSLQPQGPYHIGGSSFGGVVAFEMAQRLREQGEDVALLAFLDTYAPGYPKVLPVNSVWESYLDRLRFRLSLHWGNLQAASPQERWQYVVRKIGKWSQGRVIRWKRMQTRLARRAEALFWPRKIRESRQAGQFAYTSYRAKKYSGSAVLFRATVPPRGIEVHPTQGWSDFIQGGLEVFDTPGHHGSIVRDPRARVLAEQLTESLRKAQGRTVV
jgi:amino acid adenylation domain-containing protein